jgi:hypothetical protein
MRSEQGLTQPAEKQLAPQCFASHLHRRATVFHIKTAETAVKGDEVLITAVPSTLIQARNSSQGVGDKCHERVQ